MTHDDKNVQAKPVLALRAGVPFLENRKLSKFYRMSLPMAHDMVNLSLAYLLPYFLFRSMPLTQSRKSLACDHGRRRQNIVQSLLTEIFQGRVRAGQRLVTQDLAEQFGVSHTPIREALIELAGIGIVDLFPNRGAVVRQVTTRDVREVCQVRKALECAAVRNACGCVDLAQLHALARDIERLHTTMPRSIAGFIQQARLVDSRLHDLIGESCNNAFLAKELGRLKTVFRAFRDVAWERDEARNDHHRLAEEAQEHLAIVRALLARDAKAASQAMARHIRSGSRYWSRAIRS